MVPPCRPAAACCGGGEHAAAPSAITATASRVFMGPRSEFSVLSSQFLRSRRLSVGDGEQDQPDEIDRADGQNRERYASERVQDRHDAAIAQLLQQREQHQRAVLDRIASDQEKEQVPDQSQADEAIEVIGMGDRRRHLLTDLLLEKVQRSEDEDAVDAGRKKDTPCEL